MTSHDDLSADTILTQINPVTLPQHGQLLIYFPTAAKDLNLNFRSFNTVCSLFIMSIILFSALLIEPGV